MRSEYEIIRSIKNENIFSFLSHSCFLIPPLLMIIELKKFGTTLISRQTGREAFLALQPFLKDVKKDEIIKVDFDDILTFSPSWGDEFLTPLLNIYGDRLVLKNTSNPSVMATLEILQTTIGKRFEISN